MLERLPIPLDNELIVDNFAGGGGASTGIEMALNRPVNIAINHDKDAIGMHEANHPLTRHYCESVWDVKPHEVCQGRPVALAWFSPDCKHFSKAKGRKPVDKNIRGLAWVAVRWAATVKPRVIMLENVEEFVTWGPLRPIRDEDGNFVYDKNGKKLMEPCPLRRGMTFHSFVNALRRHGYKVEWKELRACDYGAPTIRKRLFMIARRDTQPIVWPRPTHGPEGSGLLPYRTAAECIDWSIPCPSIFDRRKPLVENTMRRIAKGLKKFVFDAAEPFIVRVNHGDSGGRRVFPLDEPMMTVTQSRGDAVVTPYVVGAGGPSRSGEPKAIDNPMHTVVAKNHSAVVTPFMARQFGNSFSTNCEEPVGTVTAGGGDKTALVAPFLTEHANASTQRVFDAEEPLRTQCAQIKGGHFALVNAFIVKHFGGFFEGAGADMTDPLPTVLTRNTQNQLCTSHIMKMYGTNVGSKSDEPLHTVTSGGYKHAEVRAFLLKYFGTDQDPRLDEPMHTVTTKDRFGLVTIMGELYRIVDIGMRMLVPRELYRTQSFPDSYIITHTADGKKLTQSAQVKMCGNSVPPLMAKALVEVNVPVSIFAQQPIAEPKTALAL